MIKLGLTGSIAMGKSTTSSLFKEQGIPIFDADKTVHELYEHELVEPIAKLFPQAIKAGKIDRPNLSKAVLNNPQALKNLEALVHPAVRKKREEFVEKAKKEGKSIVLFDIPLLYETGADKAVDKVIVVTASPETQRTRVLAREGMNEEKFHSILAKQMPDEEKRKRADYIIDTDQGLEVAKQSILKILQTL